MLAHKSEEILIRTRRNIFGANAGGNPSIFAGNGLDFAELKEYSFGDDVRTLNWKVTAREQKPYVNVFNEERELNIVCVFLESGGIFFGSKRFKQEIMAEALSLISYSALKNDDRVTTLVFSDKEEFFLPPTRALGSLHVTVPEVLGRDPLGKRVDYAALVGYLNGRIRHRSLIFLIGDFYGATRSMPSSSATASKRIPRSSAKSNCSMRKPWAAARCSSPPPSPRVTARHCRPATGRWRPIWPSTGSRRRNSIPTKSLL